MTNDTSSIKKRFIEVRNLLGLSQAELANAIGKDKTAISKIESEKEINRKPSLSIMLALEEIFNINRHYLETGNGEIFKGNAKPSLEAIPVSLHPHNDDDVTGNAKFIYAPDGTMGMRVPIVPAKAQAGYLLGYADPEYFDDFETEVIPVDQHHRGTYIGFEVRGDSMMTTDPELMENNIYPGWRAIGKDLPKQKWVYKLHTHKYDKWIIVHKTKGILIKQIIKHEVENGIITIHSLNPEYKDEELRLNDIEQIFNVVQIIPKLKK